MRYGLRKELKMSSGYLVWVATWLVIAEIAEIISIYPHNQLTSQDFKDIFLTNKAHHRTISIHENVSVLKIIIMIVNSHWVFTIRYYSKCFKCIKIVTVHNNTVRYVILSPLYKWGWNTTLMHNKSVSRAWLLSHSSARLICLYFKLYVHK